jgi:hypothetical protein
VEGPVWMLVDVVCIEALQAGELLAAAVEER